MTEFPAWETFYGAAVPVTAKPGEVVEFSPLLLHIVENIFHYMEPGFRSSFAAEDAAKPSPATVETMPSCWIVAVCVSPGGELRAYLPSEVFKGRLSLRFLRKPFSLPTAAVSGVLYVRRAAQKPARSTEGGREREIGMCRSTLSRRLRRRLNKIYGELACLIG